MIIAPHKHLVTSKQNTQEGPSIEEALIKMISSESLYRGHRGILKVPIENNKNNFEIPLYKSLGFGYAAKDTESMIYIP